jgi:hypothetical protein
MEPEDATEGSNVLQKGRFDTTGGQWKLQVDGEEAHPSCILQSDGIAGRQFAEAVAEVSVADGDWHDIECARVEDELTVTVDGAATTVPSEVGPISNGRRCGLRRPVSTRAMISSGALSMRFASAYPPALEIAAALASAPAIEA